jgi:hypothetical protein
MATVNKDFRVKNGLVVEGTTGTIDGNNILTDADTTDILDEGTTNLYYTDQRVKDVLTGSTQTNISITEVEGDLVITAENGVDDSTTDDLDEGTTNLYFTDERAQDAVAAAIQSGTHENITITYDDETNALSFVAENGISDSTTDDLDEGTTNFYFTDERAQDAVADAISNGTHENITITYNDETNSLSFVAENGVDDSTTDDLDEGTTNLYFTDTRVYDKAKTTLVEGTGIILTADDEAETITVDVDTDEIATKTYVDEIAQGLKVRGNVEAATTEDLGGTYSNGTSGVDATITIPATATLTIDGWDEWEELDGILVKDQTNPEENGRYFVFVVGDAETAWVLKRCIYCDTSEEIPGSYVFVQHGIQYASTGWVATVDNLGTFVVGTDDVNWVQFSGAGTYIGGTGIEIDGQEISIDFTEFDTDDIDEGTTNLYHTDQRVKDVLTGSTQTNISITEVDGDLIITAENGVDDATTDDLDEGTTNLYFTDQRAIDALEGTNPGFETVEINSVATQVAATSTVTTAETPTVVYEFAEAEYRSAKFLIKAAFGSHTQVSEVLLTLDSSDNISITEYAIVSTNGNLLDISAGISGADVTLLVSVENANTTITVFGTLIA